MDTAIFDGNATVGNARHLAEAGSPPIETKGVENCQTEPRARLADESESQGRVTLMSYSIVYFRSQKISNNSNVSFRREV